MLLHITSPERVPEARERLTEMGLEHFLLPSGAVFDVRSEHSIFSPPELAMRLSDLGLIEDHRSRTPILDSLGREHEVIVNVPGGIAPVRFRNFQSSVWIAGPCSLDEANDVRDTARRLSALGVRVLRGGAV